MSCKTIVTLLMLSCLSATGTTLGVTEEPPLEGGLKIFPIPEMIITEVRWIKNDVSTSVQVCVETDLPVGTPSLSYDDSINGVFIVEGNIDADLRCATFTKDATYTFAEIAARYELTVVTIDDPLDFLGRGVSTFAITVRSTLLTCGGSQITKVTWSNSETLSVDFQCIIGSSIFDKACYHDGDITGTELCFGVIDDKVLPVTVCLTGPIDNTPPSKGPISSNYFYYGPEAVSKVAADATLSLTMETVGLYEMRAIVRQAQGLRSPEAIRVAQVSSCTTVHCTFEAYDRTLATYEVCLEAMDGSLATIETATTTFTDLKLYAFDAGFQKNMLLECVFANGLLDMKYTASLLGNLPEVGVVDDPLSTINIDCTGVSPNHACFGYLDTLTSTGIVYATVSDRDGSNTIIVPFTIP